MYYRAARGCRHCCSCCNAPDCIIRLASYRFATCYVEKTLDSHACETRSLAAHYLPKAVTPEAANLAGFPEPPLAILNNQESKRKRAKNLKTWGAAVVPLVVPLLVVPLPLWDLPRALTIFKTLLYTKNASTRCQQTACRLLKLKFHYLCSSASCGYNGGKG